jgi:peptidoglycan/LPS O-acetylase OafA/YrhL
MKAARQHGKVDAMAVRTPAYQAPMALVVPAPPVAEARTTALPTVGRLYIPALDGMRFLAFFLVFLHHFPPGDTFRAWSPYLAVVTQRVSLFGWIGVDIFLTLSGFLIATLLLRELDETGQLRILRFYARRILRIWPLYYLVMVIGFFITPIVIGKAGSPGHYQMLNEHLFPFATLFGNISTAALIQSLNAMSPASDTLTILWTIALEEQFYLIFPLVLVAAGPSVRLRSILVCAAGAVAYSAATRYYIQASGISYPMVWMNTLAHLDPIVLGIAGAAVWHRHKVALLRLRLFGIDLALAVGAFWLVMTFPQIGQSNHTVWQIAAAAVGGLLMLGSALRYYPLSAAFSWQPVAWLGRISYGLYMFHILMRQLYQSEIVMLIPIGMIRGPVRWLTELLLVLLLTIVCAAVSYYALERPFLRLKDRFTVVPSRAA